MLYTLLGLDFLVPFLIDFVFLHIKKEKKKFKFWLTTIVHVDGMQYLFLTDKCEGFRTSPMGFFPNCCCPISFVPAPPPPEVKFGD